MWWLYEPILQHVSSFLNLNALHVPMLRQVYKRVESDAQASHIVTSATSIFTKLGPRVLGHVLGGPWGLF